MKRLRACLLTSCLLSEWQWRCAFAAHGIVQQAKLISSSIHVLPGDDIVEDLHRGVDAPLDDSPLDPVEQNFLHLEDILFFNRSQRDVPRGGTVFNVQCTCLLQFLTTCR